ncbi:MAG: hypothetical protein KGJ79_12175 [Alphaproteobacteria bacterium]|nr:hypothetical protein [Alphaproteobacteria bacterium]MDE2492294.1 hypothetical protein [Alphaproteobacteria bacterium]
MRRKSRLLRNLICALVAVTFAVATEPGAMAMPAAKPMTTTSAAMPACDHMKQQVDRNAPCKGMPFCFGMLACYGMAVVAAVHPPVLARISGYTPAPHLESAAPGLTHPPENPPPIA